MEERLTAHSFEAVFRESYSRYYYLALRIVGDGDVAKDLVSDVFVEVWAHRDRVHTDSLYSYLYRSVCNAAIDYAKCNQMHTSLDEADVSDLLPADDASWLAHNERMERLEQTLTDLPPRTREVLSLRYGQHRSYKETAEAMGITTDGVKKHVMKAFKLIREKMNVKKR